MESIDKGRCRWRLLVLALVILLVLGSACVVQDQVSEISVPDHDTLRLPGSEPSTLDPAISREVGSHTYIMQIFGGLVSFNENMTLVADIAEDWETDNTNTVYTFRLREDVKFHDGRPVTANDFKYSWERACDPETGSTTAETYLEDIAGVREVLDGDAKEISGVVVIDDWTLQVTIDRPKAYFLSKLAQPVAFVVDREDVEGGKDWWRQPNGTGPFRVQGWQPEKLLLLERNDLYYREKAKVRYVAFLLAPGNSMQMYERGEIDVTGVSIYNLARALDATNPLNKELAIFPEYSITYLGFNISGAPFSDVRVRQAFCHAVDRDRVVRQVLMDSVISARGILPPGMMGYDGGFAGLSYDPDKARALLRQAGYGPDGSPIRVVVTLPGSSGEVGIYMVAVLHQWEVNLGVEVEVRQLDPDAYYDRLDEEMDNVFLFGWSADYPDPQNFLDVLFRSGNVNNLGRYRVDAYDELLNRAAIEMDAGIRGQLYRQAEQRLIVEDAACLPLWFGRNYVLVKPRVTGYALSPLGIPILANVSVAD